LADAHVAALEWIAADKSSNSFNLGNDRGFSVAEVIRTAEEVTRSVIKAQMCPRRPGDPPTLVSDSTKARQLLNWKPKFPALKEQIEHAFRWFRDEMQQLAGDQVGIMACTRFG
jgi:UDP-glucose 4-epimerase